MSKPSPLEVGPAYMRPVSRDLWKKRTCAWWSVMCEGPVRLWRGWHNGAVSPFCDYHVEMRRNDIRRGKKRIRKRLKALSEPLTKMPRLKFQHYYWRDDWRWSR